MRVRQNQLKIRQSGARWLESRIGGLDLVENPVGEPIPAVVRTYECGDFGVVFQEVTTVFRVPFHPQALPEALVCSIGQIIIKF